MELKLNFLLFAASSRLSAHATCRQSLTSMSTDLISAHLEKEENCNTQERDARNLTYHHFCCFYLGLVTLLTLKEQNNGTTFTPLNQLWHASLQCLSTTSMISSMMRNMLLLLAQFPLRFFFFFHLNCIMSSCIICLYLLLTYLSLSLLIKLISAH